MGERKPGNLYDITLPIRKEHPPWPGDPRFRMEPISSIRDGTGDCNVSWIEMCSHFATHMDAPFHFEDQGITIEKIPLDILIGPVLVHETQAVEVIRPEHLPDLRDIQRILFKTANSRFITDTAFHTDFTAIGLEAAAAMTQAGIRLIGIDYFSVESFHSPGHPVHHKLCGNGVILVEGLDLREIEPGMYELIALPIKLQHGDGAPCRVALREL